MYASSWARLANFFFFFFQLYHFSAVVSRSLVGRVEDKVDSTQGLAAEGMQLVHRSSHGERKKETRDEGERERGNENEGKCYERDGLGGGWRRRKIRLSRG